GDDRCCLPAGSTGATLRGHHPELAAGQVLVLEEVKGPVTGDPADADPARRCAVRLTAVRSTDAAAPLVDPLDGTPITEIEWHAGDALPWPVCITSRDADNAAITDISVARGNVVLVDHGQQVGPEELGAARALANPPIAASDDGCEDAAGACITVSAAPRTRFRPTLGAGPLTMTALVRVAETTASGRRVRWLPADPSASATAALATSPARTRPVLTLGSTLTGVVRRWTAVPDLLASAGADLGVVAETESDGVVTLRFGDDEHGRCPEPGEAFSASYRTGNGRAGNVGPEAIAHVVSGDARIAAVRNPMAAAGGVEPETIAEVRRRAPEAFRSQRRAVTPADYEALLGRRPEVQRAAARLRWTGSWHTHFVAVDQVAARPLDEQGEAELREYVEPFRLAGHDVEFDDPMYVSLEVGLEVCVADDYFRADVRARLMEVLSNRRLADGSLGLFHPDRLTFGQTIYASPILAMARTVDGVASAQLTGFGRQGADLRAALDPGLIRLARTEIARLENDPDWPEHGLLRLDLLGGK
ncbi:MAG TPA: putative baseplate assembly protein, partial [Candidatus Acidoferrales bacterium]|nr:putative baseplate assembly protein [Candidatus Acidoferrales bacterium]